MKRVGWMVVGFIVGVAASSAVFAALPSFVDPPSPPVATIEQQPPQAEPITNDPLGELDVVARVAVVLGRTGEEGRQILLIFNGPFGDGIPTPAFTSEGRWQRNDHVVEDFVGPPESDNGYEFRPKGAAYELEYVGSPG